ncbi:hypothetical protein R3P38DRAFT_2704249 [Favolaschia claudopus]|uniref:F-box domain-containing protein n=1 Tax=Favolaschia claudopus TaxID=2862362 RepID=A0AAW0BMH3_9AGAR
MATLLPWAPAIYLEIGLCVRLHELLVLLRVCSELNVLLRHYLYRHIGCERSAGRLIDSLAKNSSLPPMVRSLTFEKPGRVCMEQWESIWPQLRNLDYLTICGNLPLPRRLQRLSTCRLTYFAAKCTVIRSWVDFIATQPDIDEMRFDREFLGPVPKPELLPKLCALKARPNDWVKFAEVYSLYHIWSYTGEGLAHDNLTFASLHRLSRSPSRLSTLRISCHDFLAIVGYAPRLLNRLRHLVLDEDLTWTEFTLSENPTGLEDSTWARVAASLTDFTYLQGIFLVCGQTALGRANRRRLRRSDGSAFSKILDSNCKAPSLKAFRFYTCDGYAIVTGMGTAERKSVFLDFPTDPWMFICPERYVGEEEYAYLFGF